MPKPVKETKPRHSQIQKDIARILYSKGDSLSIISRRVQIPESTLEGYARDGNWIEDRLPEMGIDDFYDFCLHLGIKYLSKVILSDDEVLQNNLLQRIHKLSIIMRSLVDTAPMRKATMQGFMLDVLKRHADHPHLQDVIALAQEYHDALETQTPSSI